MNNWIDVDYRDSSTLPPELETVWLYDAKRKVIYLGCLSEPERDDDGEWSRTWCVMDMGYHGSLYVESGRIVADCDTDDIYVSHWQRLPELPS